MQSKIGDIYVVDGRRKTPVSIELISTIICRPGLDQEINPTTNLASGLGLVFMTRLWHMSSEFERFTRELIEKFYGEKFAEDICY